MDSPLALPPGLTSRPLRPGDEQGVTSVIAAQELADVGEVVIELADIVADWQRPSFDLASSTVGVLDGERLVAYAEVSGGDRGDASVHPDYLGRGIGTALAKWMQGKARERGTAVIGMPVPQGSPGDRLLEALGYHVRWTSWVLELPTGHRIVERQLPEGYAVRAADPSEYETVHAVIEDAFLEWSKREREPFEDFTAEIVKRPGFEPWQVRVVADPTGVIVGAVVVQIAGDLADEAFVARLAVRKDQRGRGLAQVLLVDAFAESRRHGASRSTLSTDSRTGALSLYEKVGMEVNSVWVNRAIAL